ncbi:MAG TPA: peptide-N4-asparagine amidase [Candidatus Sulfotelmatobacter sp.]
MAFLAFAPSAFASGPYVIGLSNTVTADPNITRPSTTPCIVQLMSDAEFDNFNPVSFNYAPPADCPGPWAKVVFTADINVTAGVQYDRTANFWLGPTNIYFGTTAEPSSTLGPSWHVESDLTDYSPIFQTSQQGTADIGNLVNSTYTGIIFASSTLEFYPLAKGQTAPVTANEVFALSAGSTGGTVGLTSTTSTLSGTFTLPTNIENAYLDVYAQSQNDDEFWYTCVPNDVSGELFSCGNTGFRETEITVDGSPAGVAPIFPWIFTGGIDPWLWFPIPGVQTLNFTPYRVNLTPFAAILSNGQPHTISLSVYNSDNYFSATASLLVYLDAGSTSVSGALTRNTLTAAPSPVVTENLKVGNTITGTVGVKSNRNFTISGYVNTSHGKVTTTINQGVNFSNNQSFDITNTEYVQDINQSSSVNTTTTVATTGQPTVTYTHNLQFPLTMDISQITQSNGDINQTTKAWQTYDVQNTTKQGGVITYLSLLTNAGQHQDTLEFDSSFNLLGNSNQSASQLYNDTDSTGVNLYCTLSAANNVLTAFSPTCSQ